MNDPVLLTGAMGRVGQAILDGIGEDYEWRLLAHNPPDHEPAHPYEIADVVDEEAMAAVTDGVGAIIHLAGDPRPSAPWDSVLENNVHGTKVLYQAAVENDVDRFVYASSNHAVGHYETERRPEVYRTQSAFRLDGTELPRPGNFYGVSKAAGEILGRYYHDEYGITVCNVRIGNLTADHPPVDYERGQAMWLSPRDCAHLHDRALQAEYDYVTVYGISDNDRTFYSLETAREILGYAPQDNSAEYD